MKQILKLKKFIQAYLMVNLGFSPTGFDTEGLGPAVFHGGEAEALTRLERHLERKVRATDFIQILIELHNYRE